MRIYALSVSLLIILGITACTGKLADPPNQSVNRDWLNTLVCEFPCWQSITPQETDFDNVPAILQQTNVDVTFVDDDQISVLSDGTEGSVTRASDGKVGLIVLIVVDKQLNLGTLAQIIDTPTEILINLNPFNTDRCNASLFFPGDGTALDFYLENNSETSLDCQINIDSESLVSRIILVGHDLASSEYWQDFLIVQSDKIEWRGYGKYP